MALLIQSRYAPAYQTDPAKSTDFSDAATQINTGNNDAAVATDPTSSSSAAATGIDWRKNPKTQDITALGVTDDIMSAILAGVTHPVRRAEIYESDGVTPWQPGVTPRVIDGNVSVSQGSDSRRNLDITFDNSDGAISHDPDNGLWYDKIIKVYRGIQFTPVRKTPRIAVVGGDETTVPNARTVISRMGYSDVTFIDYTASNALSQAKGYDIIAAWKQGANFSASLASFLAQCCNLNLNVLTMNNFADQTTVPLIATSTTYTTAPAYTIQNPTSDTPFRASLPQNYTTGGMAGEVKITGIATGTRQAARSTSNITVALYREVSSGCRWFHYQPEIILDESTVDYSKQRLFLQSAINWLFNYNPTGYFEVQVGEFMIDRISEPRFPKQLSVTGRDYSKKLDLDEYLYDELHPAGEDVATVLQGVVAGSGITKMNISCPDPSSGDPAVFADDYPIAKGRSKLDIVKEICQMFTLEWFFDAKGTFVTRGFLDPVSAPTALTVKAGGTDGNLVEYTKVSDDTEMRNIIRCQNQSGNKDAPKWVCIARNDDPNSPTSTVRVGNKVENITSIWKRKSQVQAFANAQLKRRACEAYELDFDFLVFPWLEVGTIIQWVDPDGGDADFPDRLLLTDITIPLSLGPMSGTSKRVALVEVPPIPQDVN